jgi:hypothetical protein
VSKVPKIDAKLTLDQWINEHESEWPAEPCDGLRLRRGRVVWQGAYYPDGASGHLVCVYRIVYENGNTFTRVGYVPFDSQFSFVRRAP